MNKTLFQRRSALTPTASPGRWASSMTIDARPADPLLPARNHGVSVILRRIVDRSRGIVSEPIFLVDQSGLDAILVRFMISTGEYLVCPTDRLVFEENGRGDTILTPCPPRFRRTSSPWTMRVTTEHPVQTARFYLTRELHQRFEDRGLAVYHG